MIISFGAKETEKIWLGERVKGIRNQIQETGKRKLRMINNAVDLNDLKIPPAIRINDQWRIIFKLASGNASDVETTDYH